MLVWNRTKWGPTFACPRFLQPSGAFNSSDWTGGWSDGVKSQPDTTKRLLPSKGLETPAIRPGTQHAWHQYCLLADHPDGLRADP